LAEGENPFFFSIELSIPFLKEEDREDCIVSPATPGAAAAFSV
jgi:hypothetical protein